MSDDKLRDLERIWRESGDEETADEYLRERLRVDVTRHEIMLARTLAGLWLGKTLEDVATSDVLRVLGGELEGAPKPGPSGDTGLNGQIGKQGERGEPGSPLEMMINGTSYPNVRKLCLSTMDPELSLQVVGNYDGVEVRIGYFKQDAGETARDRYGRMIKKGDKVSTEDGLVGSVTGFQYASVEHMATMIEVDNHKNLGENEVELSGYEGLRPPEQKPDRGEADLLLKNAIELYRTAHDESADIPDAVRGIVLQRHSKLDITRLGLDSTTRVIRVGNLVRHRGKVYTVEEINIPPNPERGGAYGEMHQVRLNNDTVVTELEIDYVNERDVREGEMA